MSKRKPPPAPEPITLAQWAAQVGISRQQALTYARQGRIPGAKQVPVPLQSAPIWMIPADAPKPAAKPPGFPAAEKNPQPPKRPKGRPRKEVAE